MDEELGIGFYPSYLHRILRGEALRVRDFEYETLRTTRKSRAQVALEHWQLRRQELELEKAS
jgi:hypothetical protein